MDYISALFIPYVHNCGLNVPSNKHDEEYVP